MFQVRGMTKKDQMFQFLSGFQPWVSSELKRCDVQDIYYNCKPRYKNLVESKPTED